MVLAKGLKSLRYTASLIRDPKSIKEWITHVNRQRKYLKYECPRKFRVGYTCTVYIVLITEYKKLSFSEIPICGNYSIVNLYILSLA